LTADDHVKFRIYIPALIFENGKHLNNPNDCPVQSPLAPPVRQILDLNQRPKFALWSNICFPSAFIIG